MNGWSQGIYRLENREKYIGTSEPIYRSSWEHTVMRYFDTSKNILRWGSEIIKLPYVYEVDGKVHNYYIDFYVEVLTKEQITKKFIIEVKPKAQKSPPKKPKNNNQKAIRRYKYELVTYIKNQNKWKYAEIFAKNNGMEFLIIDEDTLKL